MSELDIIDRYQDSFLKALKVTESDAPPCVNTLLGRRCRVAFGQHCMCEKILHGTVVWDHPLMLVRAPRLRVLLLEPYADYEDLINNQLPPVRENLERLDLFVSVGRQGTGRWSRAAEAADYTNLSTIPIAVSPHEWLAEEVAQFDLPVTT